ncbi:hypothetical protein D3C71_842000 [compost metagenome]
MNKDIYPLEQKLVPFNGTELLGVKANDGKVYVGVRWVCEGIGLTVDQTKNERNRIQRDVVLQQGGLNFTLPTNGGNQEVLTIELDFLPLWLAKISITPNMQINQPIVAKKLAQYQLKAKDVLAEAFIHSYNDITGSEGNLLHFKKEAYMVEVAANVLRLPDSGRLKLLGDFNRQHGLVVPLPAYADEPISESASSLLKKHGVGIQTKAFNVLLLNHGILEEKIRPSSKGNTKSFKSITDAGLEYGKNIISPANPRETAPHYFPGRFADLLKRVGLKTEGGVNIDS